MIPTLPPRPLRDSAPLVLFSRTPSAGGRKKPSGRAATTVRPMPLTLHARRPGDDGRKAGGRGGKSGRSPRGGRGTSGGAHTPLWVHLFWLVPLLVFDFFFFRWLAARNQSEGGGAAGGAAVVAVAEKVAEVAESVLDLPKPPPPPVWQSMANPTPQTDLLHPDAPGVLQPTGSGRLVSAKFGSTRTRLVRGKAVAAFHEGVDIAATQRDRRGRATDPIFAVADGHVAFVNNTGGNSSYGKYIVLEHPDASVGVRTNASGTVTTSVVYTLYAHLSDVRFGIRPGAEVTAGQEIATMGRTSNTQPPIPEERAHLHWEMGLMLNSRYDRKAREEKLANQFGSYNGLNLFGIDALDFYAAHARDPEMTFGKYLDQLTVAAEVILRGRRPDFFDRYPGLWKGAAPDGGPMVICITESGMPMRGRNATAEEVAKLGNARQAVLRASPEVLGRNARGYVSQQGGKWQFSVAGRGWADHFFY